MPTVSVIIPTYKHRDFILQTLASVFAQTFLDYEVIVVNDGSPDDTAEILRPLIEAGQIRYIEQTNAGQATARNRGIAEAKGEYIALLDDDDLWPDDKLAWQVEFLENHANIRVVAGRVFDFRGELKAEKQIYNSNIIQMVTYQSLFQKNPITSPGQTLICASLLASIRGFNERIWGADDYDLWFRLSTITEIAITDRMALYYRLHEQNASHNKTRMLKNMLHVTSIHLSQVPKAQQSSLRQKAHQWIYDYTVPPIIAHTKYHFKHGNIRYTMVNILALLGFLRNSGWNRNLSSRMFRDVIAGKLLTAAQSIFTRE